MLEGEYEDEGTIHVDVELEDQTGRGEKAGMAGKSDLKMLQGAKAQGKAGTVPPFGIKVKSGTAPPFGIKVKSGTAPPFGIKVKAGTAKKFGIKVKAGTTTVPPFGIKVKAGTTTVPPFGIKVKDGGIYVFVLVLNGLCNEICSVRNCNRILRLRGTACDQDQPCGIQDQSVPFFWWDEQPSTQDRGQDMQRRKSDTMLQHWLATYGGNFIIAINLFAEGVGFFMYLRTDLCSR